MSEGGDEKKATQADFLKEHGLPTDRKTMDYFPTVSGPYMIWATKVLDKVFFAVPRWVRENLVTPNQKEYPYYHRQYRRVPTIDECYTHDHVCA